MVALALPCPSDGLSPGAQEGTLQGILHTKKLGLGAGGGSMPLAGLRWVLPLRCLPPSIPSSRRRRVAPRKQTRGRGAEELHSCLLSARQ